MVKLSLYFALLWSLIAIFCAAPLHAQDHAATDPRAAAPLKETAAENAGEAAGAAAGEEKHESGHGGVFDAHYGTWLNPIVRAFTGEAAPRMVKKADSPVLEVENHESVKYDYVAWAFLVMAGMATVGFLAGKNAKVRPEGKPTSIANMVEAAFDGFQDYLISIMGRDMARQYTPLIGTFFFTILFCNYLGLIPGLVAPTSNPNVPLGMAIVAFFAVHIIAIKEAGVKSWFMHFVGEPRWLALLNFPLLLIGELIKPLSLTIRLLCNVFGEEMVVVQLTTMAVAIMGLIYLPIPIQFPIMCLGVLFGALQALVFSTLLAIYISIMATHSDDHDAHNEPGHVEHEAVDGHTQILVHSSEATLA